MSKQENIAMIEELIHHKNRITKAQDAIYEIFPCDDAPHEEASWAMFDSYLSLVEKTLGDTDGVLGFYIFDCECGKNSYDFKGTEIKNIKNVLKYLKKQND
jgi:hypothetical protein